MNLLKKLEEKRGLDIQAYLEGGLVLTGISLAREAQEVSFFLEAPGDVKEDLLAKLKEDLAPLAPGHKVILEVTRQVDRPQKSLKDQVLDLILAYSPSASSWAGDLALEIEGANIGIDIPDYSLYFSLSNNGLKAHLEEALASLGTYQVAFTCSDKAIPTSPEEARQDFCKNLDEDEEGLCSGLAAQVPVKKEAPKTIKVQAQEDYSFGKGKFSAPTPLSQLMAPSRVTVEVDIFDVDIFTPRDPKKKNVLKLSCTDNETSLMAKAFVKAQDLADFEANFKPGAHVLILGRYDYDDFDKAQTLLISKIAPTPKEVVQDTAPEKRVEFHIHTNMSNTDGVSSAKDLVNRAADWGHEAIAITDHNVVQAYPQAMSAGKDRGIKVIYGLEADLVDDQARVLKNYDPAKKTDSFVVFDVETTGFSPINNELIEIGAVKVQGGELVDSFGEFIKPSTPIPEKITDLTGITDAMVQGAGSSDEVVAAFLDFCGDAILVAHNADFDLRFIKNKLPQGHEDYDPAYIDTLLMAQCLVEDTKNYKLGTLAKKFGIRLTDAHRAVYDAQATAKLFLAVLDLAQKKGYEGLEGLLEIDHPRPEELFPTHATIYAKNQAGLFKLYKLISESHMETFYRTARVKRSSLDKAREDLIIGSGSMEGEVFDSLIRGESWEVLKDMASFYDFLMVHPPEVYSGLLKDGLAKDQAQIKDLIRAMCDLGDDLGLPVLATGDVHYLDPQDEIFHKIIHESKGFSREAPREGAYLRTTSDMVQALGFLGQDRAYRIAVTNTRAMNERIEALKAIPDEKAPPKIKNADQDLRDSVMKKAKSIYGDPLPDIVLERLEKELKSIIDNGYAVMYKIAQDLVLQSNKDGYYVGSRGSVGSSLVATMSDITEVNPLPPHYICPSCQHSDFVENPDLPSGVDLEDKACPKCGADMIKEGHTIPFEVFLGFYGDKEPDIDLNFAGEYQSRAHKFIEENFGEDYVFRAGTIGTMAEKTAYGHVIAYCEKRGLNLPRVEINRLVKGCVGVKRTSGQHPGGIMIVPRDRDIHEFTPIQHPADKKESGIVTTHFNYEAIAENILKLDILGHDVPTILKMLEDETGVPMDKIDLKDAKTMSLFVSDQALEADPDIFKEEVGTLGIPEFGTSFVQGMLQETQPQSFSELVNISGLSHGTDVWTGNAKDLVARDQASLSEVISTREDIMNYLIQAGADNKTAFDVMEKVRKGKGIPDKYMETLQTLDLPSWYLESCSKIKYMFPKAHAVAYVTTSVRIAWYKVYYPLAFYAAFFSTKLADFDGQTIYQGVGAVKRRMEEIDQAGDEASPKDQAEYVVFQSVVEMYGRGLDFLPVDLYKSQANRFRVEEGRVRMPLQALSGLGASVAKRIEKEASQAPFLSIEDLVQRTGASKTVIEALENHGCLDTIPKENQLSLFDM